MLYIMIENFPTVAGVKAALMREAERSSLGVDHGLLVSRYGGFVGAKIDCYSNLSRAMDEGRNHINLHDQRGSSVASGLVILADSMTGTKGRFTRSWHAPQGGVWGCMLHANTLLPQSRQFIPFAVGLACCETMRSYGLESAALRWVNDVLYMGKKLAGFLIESYTAPLSGEVFNLVGFGINVNNRLFPPELEAIAGSLSACLGEDVDLSTFTEKFLARLAWNMGLLYFEEEKFLREERYSGEQGRHLLLERFLALTDTVGKRVVYGFDVMISPQYEAKIVAIDEMGGLVLRLADGYLKTEYSGEVRYL
ncbi:related to biotin acetyl-CoA carboxylase ligase [Desulfotalea psychrophila LSv54]|uniref:Related to biotin acetyl-CoA carboxylase ligase n=2 Tax=Desulfotalea psychrophila TaxID=84980 RepID=Q6AIL5_DESPS|nr:related to biotin acetyl-CoA carboxylase ligase [Desulfotalea psychrophila LSv54]